MAAATMTRAPPPAAPSIFHAPVVIGACQGCGACLLTCPEHAIRTGPATLVVLADRCTGCGECIEVCPVDAITEGAPAGPQPGPAGPAARTAR